MINIFDHQAKRVANMISHKKDNNVIQEDIILIDPFLKTIRNIQF